MLTKMWSSGHPGKTKSHLAHVTRVTRGRASFAGLSPSEKCSAIGDRDAPALDADPPGVLKLTHGARYRLTTRPDHLRDRLVGERLVDSAAARLLGEIEEQPGNATRHVEQDQPADLPVGTPQAPGELRQESPSNRGSRLDSPPEVVAPQHEELRVFHRDHMRRPRLVVDQRQLAEMLGDAEDAKDHFPAVLANQDNFDAAFPHDIQGVAGVVLEQDDAAFRVVFLARHLREPLELVGRDLPEEGNRGEEVGYFHAGREHRTLAPPGKAYQFPTEPSKLKGYENRHSSRIRDRDGRLRVRQYVRDALDPGGDPYRHLLELPPVLHREAEARRHCGTH